MSASARLKELGVELPEVAKPLASYVPAVRSGNPTTEAAPERATRQRQSERQVGNEEFAAYVAESERNAKIIRNEKLFQ